VRPCLLSLFLVEIFGIAPKVRYQNKMQLPKIALGASGEKIG
jgi:hypothetical protein